MKQFLLSEIPSADENTLKLSGKDFHYLCHVRRLSPGDRLKARDRNGSAYSLMLSETGSDFALFSIEEQLSSAPREQWDITLFQALPKGKKMDQIVRQATEAGVKTIVPFESDHSLVKLSSDKDRKAKQERWDRIVKEALQQSGSTVETTVEEPTAFSRLGSFPREGSRGFFCHQEALGEGLIYPVLSSAGEALHEIGIVIGPEGGLSPSEVDNLKKWGYDSLWFGDNVLRAETAALYAIAAVKTILRELS